MMLILAIIMLVAGVFDNLPPTRKQVERRNKKLQKKREKEEQERKQREKEFAERVDRMQYLKDEYIKEHCILKWESSANLKDW